MKLAGSVKDDVPEGASPVEPEGQLDAIREILLQQDRDRIQELEQAIENARLVAADQAEQIRLRQAKLEDLSRQIAELKAQLAEEPDDLIPQLIPQMSGIISRTIHDAREDLAEALGPVMGDAIRVQIRDSRDEMVDTLYPIILSSVQRAITEFAREFQRNVDARLKATFGPQGLLRNVLARLRGVSPSEVALRNAFPFSVQGVFLIQHETGLLIAAHQSDEAQLNDSDLMSGMLTAIRDFARDSFGDPQRGQELDEIQYGEHQIIIQSGKHAYLAIVTTGVEPEWFRARARKYLSELHIQHGTALREYEGDPESLPPSLSADVSHYALELSVTPEVSAGPSVRTKRRLVVAGGLATLVLAAVVCFYIQFTVALLPVAFGRADLSAAAIPATLPAEVVIVTATPEPTVKVEPSPTAAVMSETIPTTEPTQVSSPTPEASPTLPPSPTPTSKPIEPVEEAQTSTAVTNAPVWIRDLPGLANPVSVAIPDRTEVTLLAQYDEWTQVEWTARSGSQSGWVPTKWLTLSGPIPSYLITPTPDPDET